MSQEKRWLFFSAIGFLTFSIPAQSSSQDLDLRVLETWIEKHKSLRSLYVEFDQERKLRAVKKPMTTSGRMWMDDTGDRFRIETGTPARSIVVVDGEKDITILDNRKRTAEIIRQNSPQAARAKRLTGMFQHLFPKSLAELQQRFTITGSTARGDHQSIAMTPTDPELGKFLKSLEFHLSPDGDNLLGFRLTMKDQSEVYSKLTRSMRNPSVDNSVFAPSLESYQVKR